MIRVEVTEQFTLKDYEKIKDSIKRKSIDVKGTLFVGDTFECDKEMCDYLMGKNEQGKVVVKVIEVEPEKKTNDLESKILNADKIEVRIIDSSTGKIYEQPKKKKSSKKGE